MLDSNIKLHVVGMALKHSPANYRPIGVSLVCHVRGIDLGLTPLSFIDSLLAGCMDRWTVQADPISKSSIAWMKHSIARCGTNHAKCEGEETALPTRVLDVRDPQDIRLCETGGRPGVYIALSHCWGSPNKTFITTHDTIADMKAGFVMEQAPATFRDAISITRCLDIRYLWIDSLCIIQHDSADWSREAARMGTVYANAYLTIAAANAKDDNDSFLQRRSDASTSLRIISPTGQSAEVHLQIQLEDPDQTEEPLDARGWTLQERLLSRRSLRFGSTEMSCHCPCFSVYESHSSNRGGMRRDFIKSLKPHSTPSGTLSYCNWYGMVAEFTAQHLTYDTDKMPALSGVATEVAKFEDGTYYAGLWWEDMASGMVWFKYHEMELKKPSEYLAPSWSWASLNGRTFNRPFETDKITLPDVLFRECYLEYKSDDPHGAIKSGWLDLSAPVVKLVQRECQYSPLVYKDDLDTAFGFPSLDVRDIEMDDDGDDLKKGQYDTWGAFDLGHKDRTEALGLVLTFSYGRDGHSFHTELKDFLHCTSLYGILIEYSKKRQAYKRVGYFMVMDLEAGEAIQFLKRAKVQDIRLY